MFALDSGRLEAAGSAAGVSQAVPASVLPDASGCQAVSTPAEDVSTVADSDGSSSLGSVLPAAANWIRLRASMVRRLSRAFLVEGRNSAPLLEPFRGSVVTAGAGTCVVLGALEGAMSGTLEVREIAGLDMMEIRWGIAVPREIGLIDVDS